MSNVLAHREQFHQSRLIENVVPSSAQYQNTLHQVTNYFVAQGSSLAQAQQQAIAWIGQQVQAQASLLGFMDAFWVLMLISLSAVPLALSLRKVKLGAPPPRLTESCPLGRRRLKDVGQDGRASPHAPRPSPASASALSPSR